MRTEETKAGRLVIASNRLPLVLSQNDEGEWQVKPASGGLVTALTPVVNKRGGVWIGWPGVAAEEAVEVERLLAGAGTEMGLTFKPVLLTAEEQEKFYVGFSNEIIWPLFHDLQTRCNFDPSYWEAYNTVNRKFAEVIARDYQQGDYIWVQDYHLMQVGSDLRQLGVEASVGFFLHIPFPPLDIFLKLPWRDQVLDALLHYEIIGFQTPRDQQNFLQCVRAIRTDLTIVEEPFVHIVDGGRVVRVGAFPISIDSQEWAEAAAQSEVDEKLAAFQAALPNRQVVFGVDRLDYTKGILERLRAFNALLMRFPDLHRQVTLIQVVVPSREDIAEYGELKAEIERSVGEINGRFTEMGWVPIHYLYRSLDRTELLMYYRAARIALVTPLKDGMNLVAKEFCAANLEEKGVLVLSEFAGAAAELGEGALLVNPYDVEGVVTALRDAWEMPEEERHARMQRLRTIVREHDIFWMVDAFLSASADNEFAPRSICGANSS